MSPQLEFEANSVEQAVEMACQELSIPKDKLKYKVISYGSTGIFGLVGVKKARIAVKSPQAKQESKKPRTPPEPPPEQSEPKAPVPVEPAQDPADIPADPHETKAQPDPPATESSSEAADEPKETDSDLPEIDPEVLELGESILRLMIKSITPDADLRQTEVTDRICFQVAGGNSAVIIGKRGQTLEAIQYLVEKIVNKHNAQRVRVRVDVEGYLDKRREQLERMAEKMAGKAKKSKKPVTLGQLNAHDRRIVHLALKDDGEVRTQSMGEGFYRKLVVFPRKGKKKRNAANK